MLNSFLAGAICMGFLIAALFFVRFWRRTRDPFFLYFAAAFSVLMLERILREVLSITTEEAPKVYSLRLVAFILIIIAIVNKNRKTGVDNG